MHKMNSISVATLILACVYPAQAQTVATLKGHKHTITSIALWDVAKILEIHKVK